MAQMLIYEFNQLAGSRGGQTVFSDFNLYWGVPRHLKETPAITPGGKYMVETEPGERITFDTLEEIEEKMKERGVEKYRVLKYGDYTEEAKYF